MALLIRKSRSRSSYPTAFQNKHTRYTYIRNEFYGIVNGTKRSKFAAKRTAHRHPLLLCSAREINSPSRTRREAAFPKEDIKTRIPRSHENLVLGKIRRHKGSASGEERRIARQPCGDDDRSHHTPRFFKSHSRENPLTARARRIFFHTRVSPDRDNNRCSCVHTRAYGDLSAL